MVLAITATLIGAPTPPQPVQVNVTDLVIDETVTVTATSGTWSRTVTERLVESTQLLLVDIATPLNAPVTYTVSTSGGASAAAAPITVDYTGRDAVLQSLDGRTVAGFDWMDNADPREPDLRQAIYRPARRRRPIMYWDISGDDSGQVVAETSGEDTRNLRELLSVGAPVLLRTERGLRDIDPVDVLGITAAPRELIGAVGDLRSWTLSYTLVDDTDEFTPQIAMFSHFNTIWAGKTFEDFNTEWVGQTFADFNAFDWAGEAS